MKTIEWNKRSSNVDNDVFGIGIKTKTLKSKCGKFKISMFQFPGESWRHIPWVLRRYQVDAGGPFVNGWRHVHTDNTKTNRTKLAAEKAIIKWVKNNPRKVAA